MIYGDVEGRRPSQIAIADRMIYDAWKNNKGMTRAEAIADFNSTIFRLLDRKGYSAEEPYEQLLSAAYEACVEKQLASGKSIFEILDETS